MIILLGAEFTQEWAAEHGHAIMPEKGAVCTGVAERKARRTTAPAGAVPAIDAGPAANRVAALPTDDVAGSATGSSPCRCWSFCSTVAMR